MYRSISNWFLFAALVLTFVPASGQVRRPAEPVTETVYLHTDKDVYVAGEEIRYKAYLVNLSGIQVPCSRIIYFCLTGTGKDNIMNWRINTDSSSVSGSLPIPEDTKPGMYILTAYTEWMRNNPPSSWFSDRILVTSLKSEISPVIRSFTLQSIQNNSEKDDDTILQLHTIKNEIGAGENMEFTLDLKSHEKLSGNLSLSVTPVTPFDSLLADEDMTGEISRALLRASNPRYFTACRYKIEDRGFILSGRIIPAQGGPRNRCDVWLAVRDSVAPRIIFAPVDTLGNFRFFLSRAYDNKELIIQLADLSLTADCRIEIFGKVALPSDTLTRPYEIGIPGQAYITSVNNIRLVEAIYSNEPKPAQTEIRKVSTGFLKVPDRVVIPSDYADLMNFREIAGNILPEVRFGTRHEQFFLEVLSPNLNLWKECRIVMLNGVPFTDLAYISTLGTKEIRRIEIIQPNVLVGRATLPGLVSIYTYDGKIPENYLRSRTVRYQNNVLPAMHESPMSDAQVEQISTNFPDFRNSVYWKPFVRINSENQLKISFPAGLLTGKFMIRAEGITGNGIPLSAKSYYLVNEK